MLKRHSILLKLNIVFVITFASISVVFFILNEFVTTKSSRDFEFTLMHINSFIKDSSKDFSHLDRVKVVDDVTKELILKSADLIDINTIFTSHHKPPPRDKEHLKDMPPPPHEIFLDISKKFYFFSLDDDIYIKPLTLEDDYMFRYDDFDNKKTIFFVRVGYVIFITMMIFLYITIRKNINNLKVLQKSLQEYEKGIVDTTKIIKGEDEVAEVSKLFYKVASKLDATNKSRKLFLRNIMHELKTPLTKSKLYLGLMDESEIKDSLEVSLNRLEFLIEDMANIEKITSDNFVIEKKLYRLIDLIDDALDILFINKNNVFMGNVENVKVEVDFKLFSIVLKNLIDNGIKYSQNKSIYIYADEKNIYMSSKGEKLKYDFSHYVEPFFKGDLNDINQKGFGLGLYIVNEILQKHQFGFSYKYENPNNIFIINYKK